MVRRAVVGLVAEAVPGDGVKVDAVVGNQQVEASFTLLGVVIYAEVVHKIVNGGVVKHRVAAVQQLLQLLPEHFLQPVRNGAPGLDALGRHQLRHGRSLGGGVFLQEIRLPHQPIQGHCAASP